MKLTIIWSITEIEVPDDYLEQMGTDDPTEAVTRDFDQDPEMFYGEHGPSISSVAVG